MVIYYDLWLVYVMDVLSTHSSYSYWYGYCYLFVLVAVHILWIIYNYTLVEKSNFYTAKLFPLIHPILLFDSLCDGAEWMVACLGMTLWTSCWRTSQVWRWRGPNLLKWLCWVLRSLLGFMKVTVSWDWILIPTIFVLLSCSLYSHFLPLFFILLWPYYHFRVLNEQSYFLRRTVCPFSVGSLSVLSCYIFEKYATLIKVFL